MSGLGSEPAGRAVPANEMMVLTIVIATRNRHKVAEIEAMLGPGCAYRSLAELPESPTVIEDAATFAGNACKKAETLARWLGAQPLGVITTPTWVLADDSGLEVDALGGSPGVHSARFAALDSARAGNSSDAENNAKLLRLLANVPLERRTARFRCVITLAAVRGPEAVGPAPQLFEGVCEGRVLQTPRGQHGFGYDPLFQPTGYEATFAELGDAVKNQISHRARALSGVRRWLGGEWGRV